ncbi:uncharacterized protein IUM83_13090 [Phytophthora cinnamomi]|uniref:uncharacterized protein n=1 Tax=Phytophthora cinnamomi TaxID=4785 RepID=UPI00355A687D|nr:hypothetical protein IUM83_13090 [Phytophthora cinnamomi]
MSPRTCLTLEQKLQVHLKLKQNPGMNNPMLAEWIYATFKARVSRATLARLRNLPSSYFSHVDLSATKRRRVKFPQFERELREFFFQNEAKTAMADDVLLLKAHELAERLGIDAGSQDEQEEEEDQEPTIQPAIALRHCMELSAFLLQCAEQTDRERRALQTVTALVRETTVKAKRQRIMRDFFTCTT